MLEIKILISDLDYDGVVELAAPLAAEKLFETELEFIDEILSLKA